MLELPPDGRHSRSVRHVAALLVLLIAALVSTPTPARAEDGFDPADGRGGRIAVESGAGMVGTLAGALVGGVMGLGLGGDGGCGHASMCLPGGFALAIPAAMIGQATGVYFGGEWQGANGSYWATLGGHVVGAGAALGSILLLEALHLKGEISAPLGIAIAATLPLAGAIAGYELTTTKRAATDASAGQPSAARRPFLFQLGWIF